jgi:hypothetical protein
MIIFTAKEVAEKLGFGVIYMRRKLKKIKARKIGENYRLTEKDIEKLKRSKYGNKFHPQKYIICPNCGKKFLCKYNLSTAKYTVYCSRNCVYKSNRKSTFNRWPS